MRHYAQQCAQLIQDAYSIVVLTGAGISTSAGIPDFRGPQGLYVTRRYDPDKVFDIQAFRANSKPFYDFARDFLTLNSNIQPTLAHYFLHKLENLGKLSGIITQNIDSLHQRAGSKKVLEIHGSFWKSHCLNCKKEFSFEEMKQKIQEETIARCSCKGVIKPDVVFFGENVKYLDQCICLIEESDLLFVIGSSCVVQPAASLPFYAKGKIVIINLDKVDLLFKNIEFQVNCDIDSFFREVEDFL
ncbi:MAG: Sir2 family NAD-dependent protein deacetylase [Candidatus Omnitrophica bacterium]|nr:Sir2 family NAD-dependent protein deacetylase [Candidatus Omnitrophota bacterium]